MQDMSGNNENGSNKQRVLLVTGMLGAGKTTALRVLEDLGWEIVDNFACSTAFWKARPRPTRPAPRRSPSVSIRAPAVSIRHA